MSTKLLHLACFMLFWPFVVNVSLKIVNGVVVEPHSLPYMVALESTINERTIRCSGSLIETNKVLTAAYCVYGAKSVSITLGAHNLDEKEETQLKLTSTNFTIHEDYEDDTHLNNIAVIHLEKEVTLTDSINTISTPTLEDLLVSYNDDTGLVSGWGRYNDTIPDYSDVLRKIEVTIIPYLACTISYLGQIKSSQMCTSGMQDGQNICLGDTGSPLVVNGTQVGIASYGSDFGCSVGMPGVYTRLTSYFFWLTRV
ncbi:unnamed protein product [Ceutorhynchus assimilis]|uniref:Peptidase S1 domain-containing protein n=1 Tax=Ceutorhynchus assimilis TaxID=467358 RepID=A0A9N9QMD5_9CUCU|nr:unnamed protein product [Ceutorhynchus assimilis]